ncbi:hypothetical protein SBOR_7837 [Sclerotinia borealis F-4128]|uniref:Uncharacterized protein n=1 Tax=Sclerotinia borealis (strain F-4128) TaxID=1432307 RepID=W9C4S6_SCLBF|nr:hypothetical protein SBOR_7837 [Sclerotinia borealis F-4128]
MDAAEDDKDIRLQRESGELLEDFKQSLHPFLYNVNNKGQLRRRVRIRETERLAALLDEFQELPQLLDPHLQQLVPKLANAFHASISKPPSRASTTHTQLLIPLRKAICILLYKFCKVRGEKVIVHFLSTETRHIHLLLSAIEKGTLVNNDAYETPVDEVWSWEERYITLLWLSQLLMAPFDLDSLSSTPSPSGILCVIPGLYLPVNVPDVALRSILLALKYLSSSGKEKDAAKILLVRVVLRKDMRDLGLLHSLVMWTISALQSTDAKRDIHYINGLLSFLSGVLVSSMDTAYMEPYLDSIFRANQKIMEKSDRSFAEIHNSAVTIKLAIKIFRSTTLLNLRPSFTPTYDILNESAEFIFEMLSDLSTPVRLAASKALSVIILNIHPQDARSFVSTIIAMLTPIADALTWHGQILTLSHLLYRRSAPREQLGEIVALLLRALSFERKTLSGSSTGTNVRDAANFGIWSLARRYSTAELQNISTESKEFVHTWETKTTIQILATHLVVSACLDPAGNIRRGSSAALQELIGRHPGTIIEALDLVQIVDYHAVALRSRGILEVAVSASFLAYSTQHEKQRHHYGEALLEALRGWRGIGDINIVTRRNCAEAFRCINFSVGDVSHSNTYKNAYETICSLQEQLKKLQKRQANERHGLLLFTSAAILEYPKLYTDAGTTLASIGPFQRVLSILEIINPYVQEMIDGQYYRPALIAEALCCVIFHSFRLFGMYIMLEWQYQTPHSPAASEILRWVRHSKTKNVLMFRYEKPYSEHMIDSPISPWIRMSLGPNNTRGDRRFWRLAESFVSTVLDIDPAMSTLWSACARRLFFLSPPGHRRLMIDSWLECIRNSTKVSTVERNRNRLRFSAAWIAFSLDPAYEDEIRIAIHGSWKSTEIVYDLETRIALVSCLAIESNAPASQIIQFWDIISDGLDDYHTDNTHGDVGSRVRLEAIKGAGILLSTELARGPANEKVFSTIFGKVLRLCTERLDKVRTEAKKAILSILVSSPETSSFEQSSISSYEHFRFILDLQTTDRQITTIPKSPWRTSWTDRLLEGYVTSAHGGTEDLVRLSRAALIDFCAMDQKNSECIGPSLVRNLETHHRENDRVIIPTLEITALLLDMGLMYKFYPIFHYRTLCTLIAKEAINSRIDKCKAAAKCFGRLTLAYPNAIDRLLKMLWHNYPTVRVAAVDELWDLGITCVKGRDFKFMENKPSGEFGKELYRQCMELGFKDGAIVKELGKLCV